MAQPLPDPRKLMQLAIKVMRQSVLEPRANGKTSPKVGAVLVKSDGTVETACRGKLRQDSLRFIERNTRTAYRIEKLQREEIPEYPVAALREAITNAVMHRDYFIEGANVFVEIYEDRIEVSSPGGLPKGMLPEDLGSKSVRRNPLIADLLHRIAFIEKAGTGIKRMREGARDQGYPEPEFSNGGFFSAVFRPIATAAGHVKAHDQDHETQQVPPKYPPSTPQVLAILGAAALGEKTREELQDAAEIKDRKHFRTQYLKDLLAADLLERTIPDKPHSSNQRYRITLAGRAVLEKQKKETAP